MQGVMDRLAVFLERRRWPVLAAWLVVLAAALPFAAQQTEHLTSGGFSTMGTSCSVASARMRSATASAPLARQSGAAIDLSYWSATA